MGNKKININLNGGPVHGMPGLKEVVVNSTNSICAPSEGGFILGG